MAALTEISVSDLSRLVGTPRAPVLIDVRDDDDFAADPRVIPTARRVPHRSVCELATGFQGRKVVVTCQKGLKLSHGAAALLRAEGIAAESLEGGHLAWAQAGEPLIPAARIPESPLWVTRARPKIDRIACPWLIRRFVNPEARFLYVPASEAHAVAERFGATPFDMPEGEWTHRGEGCTFDTMLAEWGLETEALKILACVVRAADTNRHDLAPEAAGLLALSVGLSRQYRDDLAQLEAGMALYDALYAWARDGQGEGHDWPPARVQTR
jgi:rhodanese-related sulfurtransferase